VLQVGDLNAIYADQFESIGSTLALYQQGSGNVHFTYQNGDSHVLNATSVGNGNKVYASNWKGPQSGGQFGSNQSATVTQAGNGNVASFTQDGVGHIMTTQQTGSGNKTTVSQAESYNELYFDQNGSDNILISDQRGTTNLVQGFSNGTGNSAEFDQSGTGNHTAVWQRQHDHGQTGRYDERGVRDPGRDGEHCQCRSEWGYADGQYSTVRVG
jgi:hypothetical protein